MDFVTYFTLGLFSKKKSRRLLLKILHLLRSSLSSGKFRELKLTVVTNMNILHSIYELELIHVDVFNFQEWK